MDAHTSPRVTLVHDWLTGMRGGEKCLEPLCRRWPHAKLLTLLHQLGSVSADIERLGPRTSFLNRLPGVQRYYRYLLPLMPAAMAALRVPPSDLVVSFSHCVAKNVRVPAGTPHACYCFTPVRYAWHMRESYFTDRVRGLKARLLDGFLGLLRAWDRRTAAGVTHFIAISETIRRRIAECYGRESTVIYPPVDTDFYHPVPVPREDYYLVVSAFAPYKRLDLAVAACQRLGRPLVVIGTGQDGDRLRALAGPNTRFLGWQPDHVIRDHLRRCRALLFPGEEDFGIVPVEAMA
jgi:glycosyltransferase involved in cell wall biosynthesis